MGASLLLPPFPLLRRSHSLFPPLILKRMNEESPFLPYFFFLFFPPRRCAPNFSSQRRVNRERPFSVAATKASPHDRVSSRFPPDPTFFLSRLGRHHSFFLFPSKQCMGPSIPLAGCDFFSPLSRMRINSFSPPARMSQTPFSLIPNPSSIRDQLLLAFPSKCGLPAFFFPP